MSDRALDLVMALDKNSIFKRWKINLQPTLRSKDERLNKAGGKCNSKEKWMQENFWRRNRKDLFTKDKWRKRKSQKPFEGGAITYAFS